MPSADRGVQELFAVNAGAVAALLQYAHLARARRFVLGSTGGVYGYCATRIRENVQPRPFDAYTLSKWHGETIARQAEQAGGVPVAIIRYFFPYGPRQQEGIINRLARRIVAGDPVMLHANGRHPRLNPVFITDACELTRRALDANMSLTVNCAGPEVATIRQIATIIGELAGIAPRFEPSNNRNIGDMIASNAHARRALRFLPSVGLRDGLTATFTTT
jgi:nucleoside-diphosphate-sugar epimerase